MLYRNWRDNRTSKLGAFTLVELLVVIGIIALLISMLLPALNKARQQANFVDCQSRLRQMGQALAIYVTDSKGYYPWGVVVRGESWEDHSLPNATDKEPYWWWDFTLGQIIDRHLLGNDGMVHNLSGVFRDRDTIDPPTGARYTNHYTVNERVFWGNMDGDLLKSVYSNDPTIGAVIGNDLKLRKAGTVKPTNVFLIWDGPQAMDYGYNTYELATELDGNQLRFGHCFCLGSTNPGENYNRPVNPGGNTQSQIATVTRTLQKKYNADLLSAFNPPDGWNTQIRFRHLNNTTMNALCLDGHVEKREVGSAMVTDFCTNLPQF
jgi:type II secretory pathway pseudopilin PulG